MSSDQSLAKIAEAFTGLDQAVIAYEKAVKETVGLEDVLESLRKELEAAGLDRDPALQTINLNSAALIDLEAAMSANIEQTRLLVEELANRRGFASGGYVTGPGGIDNVPINVTAGEYVINAAATRANLPLLHAINSRGRGYAGGGNVQNIQFGDINIQGGRSSEMTARSVVRDIKREMRRGTVTL